MKLATVLLTSILSIPTLAAHATAPADPDGITVPYADLDLNKNAGIQALYRRIQGAARRVCDVNAARMLVTQRSYARCVDDAIAAAVVDVDRPLLTEYVALRALRTKTNADTRIAGR